jgi:hypothetical protein
MGVIVKTYGSVSIVLHVYLPGVHMHTSLALMPHLASVITCTPECHPYSYTNTHR